ncbi:MAG: AEC family transporter, partial [Burkholderiales bacterium]|nr:AEC family transporter [Burkholderiales bacterium]
FDAHQTQALNKVVLDIELPEELFISITKATRHMLFEDITLTIVAFAGVIIMFFISFFICWKFWRHTVKEAAVCALIAGSPTIGFLGFAVLDPIFGATTETGLVVAIVAIVVNAVTIPIGFYLLNLGGSPLDSQKPEAQQAAAKAALGTPAATTAKAATTTAQTTATPAPAAQATPAPATTPAPAPAAKAAPAKKNSSGGSLHALINALEQPVVWSPILAVIIVLIGIRIPDYFYPSFTLIAKANSGVAVFAAGLALASVKFSLGFEIIWNTFYRVLLTPFCIGLVAVWCGIYGEKLEMLVMSVALPPAFSGIIISSRYQIYVRDGASSLAVSTFAFAFAAPFWMWFTPMMQHWFM